MHSVASFESCCKYHIKSVGVLFCVSIHFTSSSVSSPACSSARIAKAVSFTFAQWLFVSLSFSAWTHSSKTESLGVARIVRDISWTLKSEQEPSTSSSRHSKPASIPSAVDCVDVELVVVVSVVFVVEFVSLSAASAMEKEKSDRTNNKTTNTPTFFMFLLGVGDLLMFCRRGLLP